MNCRTLPFTIIFAAVVGAHGEPVTGEHVEERHADAVGSTVEELRLAYRAAADAAAKIQRPESGTPGFGEKLKVWSAARRKQSSRVS